MLIFIRRAARWALPVIILVEIVLVSGHVLTSGMAVVAAGAIEGITIFLGSLQALRAVRRVVQRRRAGEDFWDALTEGLAVFVPRSLARVIALEPRIWLSIFIWLFRRPRPDATTFPYAADSVVGVFTIAVLFSAPVEVLLAEVLVPWGWLRLALVGLEIYTIVWLLGYAASLAVLPHRLTKQHLILHYGLLLDVPIPYTNIATLRCERRNSPQGREGYSFVAEHRELALVIGGATNVVLTLHTPQTFSGLLRRTPPMQTIALKVDEPDRFVNAVAQRLDSQPDVAPLVASQPPS